MIDETKRLIRLGGRPPATRCRPRNPQEATPSTENPNHFRPIYRFVCSWATSAVEVDKLSPPSAAPSKAKRQRRSRGSPTIDTDLVR